MIEMSVKALLFVLSNLNNELRMSFGKALSFLPK